MYNHLKTGGALWTLLLVLFFGACRQTGTPTNLTNRPKLAVEGARCIRGRNGRFWVSGTVANVGDTPLNDLFIGFNSEPPFFSGRFSTYFLPDLAPYQSLSFSMPGEGTNPPSESKGGYIGRGTVGVNSRKDNYYLSSQELPCWSDQTVNVVDSPLPTECAGHLESLDVSLYFKMVVNPNGQLVDRPMPEGTCYFVNSMVSRWVTPTEALIGRDDRFALIEFTSQPKSRRGINAAVARKAGTFPYKNEFGASYPIPRLKLLSNITSFEEPAKATDSSPIH
jgi:hypothetical protein